MEIHIGNRVADVTLVSKEGNKVRLSIDGKPYDVDIVMTENGSCSVLHDGNSFNAEIISGEDHRSYDVNMFYRSYHVGKVVKIPVRKGDRLETGDTVVVLEAMKMQSNYKVSSACVVKDILVSEGDSVDNNQVLMTLDLLKDDSYE